MQVSALACARNEEARLADCLRALRGFDEIALMAGLYPVLSHLRAKEVLAARRRQQARPAAEIEAVLQGAG